MPGLALVWMAGHRMAGRIAAAALALTALWFAAPANADVWGYVDDRGVGHFAAEPLDARYELFFRGGAAADAAPAAVAIEMPRPVAVPTAPPKLLAFFDVSPNFKAVKHHLRDASRQHRIDYELLQALIATESGFDPAVVSPKGAVGLMQVMPVTAARFGVAADRRQRVDQKLLDPQTNISTGSRYFRYLLDLFPGQLELALAAYNAGEGAVQRAGNRVPAYPETRNYVNTVLQLYRMLKPPSLVAPPAPTKPASPARVPLSGGAAGRSNMISPLGAGPAKPEIRLERD